MGALEDVLARLVNDPGFREMLASDPATALAGYDLTGDDLEVLAASLDEDVGDEHGVEQRTSKSALLGFLSSLTGDGGGSTAKGGKRVPYLMWELKQARGGDAIDDLVAPQPSEAPGGGEQIEIDSFSWGATKSGDEVPGDPDNPVVVGSPPNPPPDAGGDGQADIVTSAGVGGGPHDDGDYVVTGVEHDADGPPVPTPYPNVAQDHDDALSSDRISKLDSFTWKQSGGDDAPPGDPDELAAEPEGDEGLTGYLKVDDIAGESKG